MMSVSRVSLASLTVIVSVPFPDGFLTSSLDAFFVTDFFGDVAATAALVGSGWITGRYFLGGSGAPAVGAVMNSADMVAPSVLPSPLGSYMLLIGITPALSSLFSWRPSIPLVANFA